ncbi:MAG: amidohydrolase family protein [Phycisphaeraceae bacterium]|nr:amidohydrolase family protein [Phycisphaeraceae bacterium]
MNNQPITVFHAAAIRDPRGLSVRPAALALDPAGRILAADSPAQVRKFLSDRPFRTIDLGPRLLLPPMVNAHAHLDLTLLGPRPYHGDFPAWLRSVTQSRLANLDSAPQAVHVGLELSRHQGVAAIGDIAGSPDAAQAFLTSGGSGVSFLECFGPLGFEPRAIARLDQVLASFDPPPVSAPGSAGGYSSASPASPPRLGLSPHAPYTTWHPVYAHATSLHRAHAYPLCTHLAESPEELEFIAHATGFFVDHLKHYHQWSDTYAPTGQHPVDWMLPHLDAAPWLLAHCNYVTDDHIAALAAALAAARASVAYCPLASAYFGHPIPGTPGFTSGGGHRYRDMLAAGVNVCLGTDSILCQPPEEIEPQPMSILAPMRMLHRRDKTSPELLLKMATTHGYRALGLDDSLAALTPSSTVWPWPASPRLIAVPIDPDDPTDPLEQALRRSDPLEPIFLPRA